MSRGAGRTRFRIYTQLDVSAIVVLIGGGVQVLIPAKYAPPLRSLLTRADEKVSGRGLRIRPLIGEGRRCHSSTREIPPLVPRFNASDSALVSCGLGRLPQVSREIDATESTRLCSLRRVDCVLWSGNAPVIGIICLLGIRVTNLR